MQEPLSSSQDLAQWMDTVYSRMCGAQWELFKFIREADRCRIWEETGARDLAAWLSLRYGISPWRARRWIGAAHALERLPQISRAFLMGELGIDKVCELTRFATAETEKKLMGWAQRVSAGAIRRKADLAERKSIETDRDAERNRGLSYWFEDDGRVFGLYCYLPAAQGAAVANGIDRVVEQLPVAPGEEDTHLEARRADPWWP